MPNVFLYIKDNRSGLIFVIITWLIFFSRILFGGQLYFFDDLKIIYYPLEHVYAQFQAQWELPQWSNDFGFGHPLIAWGQLGFFTPLHLILRFFGIHPLILLNTSIMAYFLIGLIGMFTFLRARAFSQPAAALGATLFVFGGFTIGHLQHVNFFTSTMLLPWLLLAAHLLIAKPTIRRAVLLALIGAAIALSGQPQVILFTFIIAAIISVALFIQHLHNPKSKTLEVQLPRFGGGIKIVAFTVLAGILALGLSSFAILPLLEFLPLTDRAGGLAPSELYEFSYPPWHAITLIFPYFFGDAQNYWGAKGFQELAAFVGIIPLFLAGAAISQWKSHKPERCAGIVLAAVGAIFALGKYSPAYTFLVEHHYLQSLGVSSRFAYFFILGIVLLSASGIDDLMKKRAFIPIVSGMLLTGFFLSPFLWYIQYDSRSYIQLLNILSSWNIQLITILFGVAIIITHFLIRSRSQLHDITSHLLTLGTVVTLLIYAWGYNPITPREIALKDSPLTATLSEYNGISQTPARLYSDDRLALSKTSITRPTEPISPRFTVYQPFTATEANLSCLYLPMQTDIRANGTVMFAIREKPHTEPIRIISMNSSDVSNVDDQHICFPPIKDSAQKTYWLTISSSSDSRVVLFYRHSNQPDQQVYFVRVPNATAEQFNHSRKAATLIFSQIYRASADKDAAMLSRHMNAIAGASSARWIGALAIRPYRDFIETFFANDSEPVDGDGIYAIQRNRKILDMSGVTHVIRLTSDGTQNTVIQSNYELIDSARIGSKQAYLYRNREAFPRAFMVRNAVWKPAADETRHALLDNAYNPRQLVYISGPTPPKELPRHSSEPLNASATITRYDPTQVDVAVTTEEDAILVLTDSWTPQWLTFIDNAPALQLVANSVFKSALVPAGTHVVSFRYVSPAIEQSRKLTITSLIAILVLLAVSNTKLYERNSNAPNSTP